MTIIARRLFCLLWNPKIEQLNDKSIREEYAGKSRASCTQVIRSRARSVHSQCGTVYVPRGPVFSHGNGVPPPRLPTWFFSRPWENFENKAFGLALTTRKPTFPSFSFCSSSVSREHKFKRLGRSGGRRNKGRVFLIAVEIFFFFSGTKEKAKSR